MQSLCAIFPFPGTCACFVRCIVRCLCVHVLMCMLVCGRCSGMRVHTLSCLAEPVCSSAMDTAIM